MQQLYVDTIQSVCRKDYNQEQINVWISSVDNTVKRFEKPMRAFGGNKPKFNIFHAKQNKGITQRSPSFSSLRALRINFPAFA
jgi:hypothetical protein